MKKIYLLACTFILSVVVNAQTKTFIGAHNSQWSDALNWSPAGLPGPGDKVVIDNNYTVYLDRAAIVKCIALYNGAKLVTEKPLSIPDELSTFPQAIYLGSGTTLEVTNQLNIGSGPTANITKGINIAAPDANVIISSGGILSIDRCESGVYIDAGKVTINSGGSLKIGQQAPITDQGILMDIGTLENNGTVLIDNIQGPAIATATFPASTGVRIINNSGELKIGSIGNVTGAGIKAIDAATNNSGSISIDRTADGIQLTHGSFTNNGYIIVGNTAAVTGTAIVTFKTDITNSDHLIIKNTQGDGMKLTDGNFTNDGRINIGFNDVITGNCGGIGIHADRTVIRNNNYIDFGTVGSHSMQLENASSFTNSGTIAGGSLFVGGFPSINTAIHGNLMVLEHSIFTNAATGIYYAYNSNINMTIDGIVLNNSSQFENRGTLKILGPKNISLSLNGNSDFRNYGFLEAYYGLTRALSVAGGSLFENNEGGSIHFGGLRIDGQSVIHITGSKSKLINKDSMLVDYSPRQAITIDQEGGLQNVAGAILQIGQIQQNGMELTDLGSVNNAGTIELNEIANIPLHASGGSNITNDGMLKVGNSSTTTKTGISLEGISTKFDNNPAGQITVNRTAATYNGIQVTAAAIFRNAGKITWGTSSLAFAGGAALQVITGGRFDNRSLTSAVLGFVNCAGDAIVADVSGIAGGSSLAFNAGGTVQFGNINGRGIYNTGPDVVLLNKGTFETLPDGKMNLQATINNSGPASVLSNNDGIVNLGYPFSNSGTVTNGGSLLNQSTFTNASGGQVNNTGVWNMLGTFDNNLNSICRGSGTFKTSVFRNNGGTVAPGNSPGCMNMLNGFNQSSGILDIEVNGKNTPCTEFDRLKITGPATLSGTLKVTFSGAYIPSLNDEITILKSSSLVGVFSGDNLPDGWTILYNIPAAGDVTLKRIATLPLSLLRLAVQKEGNTVDISWTTTDEVNTHHFELERSADGNQFQKIGTIPSMNVPGDQNYSYVDAQPFSGRNYYRIKMVDIDGTFTYSHIVSLHSGETKAIQAIYPNPAIDVVNVIVTESSNDLSIQLISIDGKILQTKRLAVRGTYQLNVAKLPAGIYFIKVSTGEIHKLIKR